MLKYSDSVSVSEVIRKMAPNYPDLPGSPDLSTKSNNNKNNKSNNKKGKAPPSSPLSQTAEVVIEDFDKYEVRRAAVGTGIFSSLFTLSLVRIQPISVFILISI